jgi:hypothetical protein
MGARHRRETTADTAGREKIRDSRTTRSAAPALHGRIVSRPSIGGSFGGTSIGGPSGNGVPRRGLTGARHRRPEEPDERQPQKIQSSASAGKEACAFVWLRMRYWCLEKRVAERLVYILKSRSITVLLASLTLQLPGLLASRKFIILLAFTAGCVNWAAEYIKHQIGSDGVSITIGVRRARWMLVVPWLHADANG